MTKLKFYIFVATVTITLLALPFALIYMNPGVYHMSAIDWVLVVCMALLPAVAFIVHRKDLIRPEVKHEG